LFDTSVLTDELKVCVYPATTREVLNGMSEHLDFFKMEKTVEKGKVLGFNGTGWVLADKDDATTLQYLHLVVDKQNSNIFISNHCQYKVNRANGIAYLGNSGNITYNSTESNIKVGFVVDFILYFFGE